MYFAPVIEDRTKGKTEQKVTEQKVKSPREKAFEITDYESVFNLQTVGPYGAMTKIKPGATLLFLSGLCSRDNSTGEIVGGSGESGEGDFKTQTVNIMERIKTALASTGATMEDIYYLHVWLDENVSLEDKKNIVDPAFGQYFKGRVPPCNVVMGIKRMYMHKSGANIEIEAWAAVMEEPS